MESFDKTRWSPLGSRPHIEIPASAEVAALVDAYVRQTAAWWTKQSNGRSFDDVFRLIAAEFLHMTVGWVDQLTADLEPGKFDDLHERLVSRLAEVDAFEVTVGPAIVSRCALELYIVPTAEASRLAAAVRAAIRDTFGAHAAREPEPARLWRPHLSAFYSRAEVNTDGLASAVGYTLVPGEERLITPVTMPVDAVLLVDQDTWGPDGLAWNQDTARRIALGAR